ncbi:hypothetical protein T12_6353 [Trichinella patagoniensis]|uniref:Uncharacterized protein n=1 Tax=Trichinella patagoniensis TaxID=990121 RepID=A0A0V0ZH90_9BILA|nr:hypothetical protein T12_6353 [Trichinella patagoniensis]
MKILDFRLGQVKHYKLKTIAMYKEFQLWEIMRIDGLEASDGEDFHWSNTETETEEENGEIVNCPFEQQNVDSVSRDDCGGQLGYLEANLNLLNRILKKNV